MKNPTPYLILGAIALVCGATRVHSQAPAAPNRVQQLKTLHERNERILEQQTVTLQKLDELKKEAEQLRIFARRS